MYTKCFSANSSKATGSPKLFNNMIFQLNMNTVIQIISMTL